MRTEIPPQSNLESIEKTVTDFTCRRWKAAEQPRQKNAANMLAMSGKIGM